MEKNIILVNGQDQEIGLGEKMEVHEKGLLHRAFSIFVLNSKNQLMLQKRALNKYHSGGLWSNTCCSHPSPGSEMKDFIKKRLKEEMGFECEPQFLFPFQYKAALDKGLTENELDHIYLGYYDGNPSPSPEEVSDWKWMDLEELHEDLIQGPEKYTYWFLRLFPVFRVWMIKNKFSSR